MMKRPPQACSFRSCATASGSPATPLADVRQYATDQLAHLPDRLRTLDRSDPYSVTVSPSLQECARALDAQNIRNADNSKRPSKRR